LVTINPQKLTGNWRAGIALDVHTISSTHLGINEAGHDVFDTKRSELGELLYRLKYRGDETAAKEIVEAASKFLAAHRAKFDLIVPVPPSGVRALQPVMKLATGVGAALDVPVIQCVTTVREATQLKGVIDPERRKELLDGLHTVDATHTVGKNVLLFDDLYRSGSTMNVISNLLMTSGQAAGVRAFAITRTRRNL
jgi:competence protein ComFC